MTDRELLELAAKAAGITIDPIDAMHEPENWFGWNPLMDDGDALRLAVKLALNIEHMRTMGGAPFGISCWPIGRGDCGANETDIEDYAAATRRAIVRAAAEIAKAGEPKCVMEK